MRRKEVSELTTGLVYDLTKIVAIVFCNVSTIDEFVEVFNSTFPFFQNRNKLRLDPDAIYKEGMVSCSSGALLLAIWWNMTQDSQATLYLATGKDVDTGANPNHIKVHIPSDNKGKYYHVVSREDKTKAILKEAHEPWDSYRPYDNIGTLAAIRLSKYGLTDQAKKRVLDTSVDTLKQEIMNYQGKPTEYFIFLKHCYVQLVSQLATAN